MQTAACNFTENDIIYKHYSSILFNLQENLFQRKDISGCFRNNLSYRLYFSNTTKWLSQKMGKYIRLLIKKIAGKQNKIYNKMKLRLKLKFVNNKLCPGTRYGFFYKLYKFVCRSLRQTRFGVTDNILVNFLNFEQI